VCVVVEQSNGKCNDEVWLGWLETCFGRQKETSHDAEYDLAVPCFVIISISK